MTDLDLTKMILSHEINRCRGYVGTEMVNSIDNGNIEYTELLNEVYKHLSSCVELLKYKGNKK